MAMKAMKTGAKTAQSLIVKPVLASVAMPNIRLYLQGRKQQLRRTQR